MQVIKGIFVEGTDVRAEMADVPEAELNALITLDKALGNSYMPPEDRNLVRSLIDKDTWGYYHLEENLCRKARMDPDLKVETRLRGDEVRFEALLNVRALIVGNILAHEIKASEAIEAAQRKQRLEREAQERASKLRERSARTERDARELSAWWAGLSDQERGMGLRGVLLSLDISGKEMDELWEGADLETKIRLMAMAMYALEAKPHKLAKDVRAKQATKPMKKDRGRRGHLRLVTEAA